MNYRTALLAAGASALALAVLVASPLPADVGVRLASSPAASALVGAAGLAVGIFGLAILLFAESTPDRPGARTTDRRADPRAFDRVVGADLEDAIESLSRGADDADSPYPWHGPRSHLRSELRDLAVAILVDRGHDREAAERLVAAGRWTDDPRAAAFLGSDAPTVPLRLRVRDWAEGAGERRRAEHAVQAVAALAGEEVDA